jgi:precorrin-6Y C5,15-methyltransferase (decarboxylating)
VTAWLTIIGVGEGGVEELPAATRALIDAAKTVLGPERFLGLTTPTPDPSPQGGGGRLPHLSSLANATEIAAPSSPSPLRGGRRQPGGGREASTKLVPWHSPLSAMLDQITTLRGTHTVILATGDPMWFGIGATLAKHFDLTEFTVHPHPSAFQLAAARLHWPLQYVATISLHGRAVETLHPHLVPGNRILALTSDRSTVEAAKVILESRGYGQSRLTVLENLGGADERISTAMAADFDLAVGDFYVLAIDCVADDGAPLLPPVPGLPDAAFISDGQLTKREVRAATLAKLAPFPGALLWDVGAGCGSVAIEWLRAVRDTTAIAFEREATRLEMIGANANALGTPALKIVAGDAPASLEGHAGPDAIFIGGDVSNEALFDACWAALKPGGRLVANAVTLDSEQTLYARHAELGGDLTRIEVSMLDAVGGHRVMRPRLAVTQYLVLKP